ncbi:MAG: amino acid ABC transporter substrate-binding protein [Variibacter sp.]
MLDDAKTKITANRRSFLLGGAGVAAAAVSTNVAQAESCPEDTLDRIQRTGVFNLGARESAPPYGFKDADGKYTGFATEMALAIYNNVNKELGGKISINYVPVTSQTRQPLLQNGTIDMEAGATVVTQGRAKVVDFLVPHFLTATAAMVLSDSPIKSLADLAGKRVGVPQGGLEEASYRELNNRKVLSAPVRTVGFPDHAQGVTALQTGTIDVYSSDEPILYGFAGKQKNLRVFAININSFLQACILRPSSPKFKRIADITLVNIFISGEWNKLFDKYFGPSSATPMELTDQLKTMVLMNSWPA